MRMEIELQTESPTIATRPSIRSSSRKASIAILSSVLVHGGLLSACVFLSQDLLRTTHIRRGQATVQLQLAMSLPPMNQPQPIAVEFEPTQTGESDLDRIAKALVEHRGIQQQRRIEPSLSLPSPEAQPSLGPMIQPTTYQPRAEALDELRPRQLEAARRPRREFQHSPALATPPSSDMVGTESWIPEPLSNNEPPNYPRDAVARRAKGTTLLRIMVTNEGTVASVEIKQSSGWPLLDDAAAAAVASWRFQPQTSMLAARSQTVVIPVAFQLNR